MTLWREALRDSESRSRWPACARNEHVRARSYASIAKLTITGAQRDATHNNAVDVYDDVVCMCALAACTHVHAMRTSEVALPRGGAVPSPFSPLGLRIESGDPATGEMLPGRAAPVVRTPGTRTQCNVRSVAFSQTLRLARSWTTCSSFRRSCPVPACHWRTRCFPCRVLSSVSVIAASLRLLVSSDVLAVTTLHPWRKQ